MKTAKNATTTRFLFLVALALSVCLSGCQSTSTVNTKESIGAPPHAIAAAQPARPQSEAVPSAGRVGEVAKIQIQESYGRLPIYFVENRGQLNDAVRFYEKARGRSIFITREDITLVLGAGKDAGVIRMKAEGKTDRVEVSGENPREARINYLVGNNPGKWRTDIPTYGKVRYREIYPAIDLVFYDSDRKLEFDFEVSPGADLQAVKLSFEGADKLELTPEGDLKVFKGERYALYRKPAAFQEINGARREVASFYRVENDGVSFETAAYDRTKKLVIDPVLDYSSYLGGSGSDEAIAIAVGGGGGVFVAGSTAPPPPPPASSTKDPCQADLSGEGYDVFVTKLSPAGDTLVYSTYLGGSKTDEASGLAVDAAGSAYVTGITHSPDFPTENPFQAAKRARTDAFVTKLNPAGNALVYSTYLGGWAGDRAYAIAVDAAGSAYVAGVTNSGKNFPRKNAFQLKFGGGTNDAFVTKFSPDGATLVYSTFLGGSDQEGAYAIAVDAGGSAYVAGYTTSSDFPTKNPYQADYAGGYGQRDAFVTKFGPAGKALIYSTYLGGSSGDAAFAIAVDAKGAAYVAGTTSSPDFPTVNAFQPIYGAIRSDAFVTKIKPSGKTLAYSTFLGGSDEEGAGAIAVDSEGCAYVAGVTNSPDFPMKDPFQAVFGGGYWDAFVTKFGPAGKALVYSTYLGGGGENTADKGRAIAVDAQGAAYVAGWTTSTDFPTKDPFQAVFGGYFDAFFTKFSTTSPP